MANTIDYSKLKKASEVLETASHTTIPTATRAQASQPVSGGRAALPFPEGVSQAVQGQSVHDQPGHRRWPLSQVLLPTAKHSEPVSSSGDRHDPSAAQGALRMAGGTFPGSRGSVQDTALGRGDVRKQTTCLWLGASGGPRVSPLLPGAQHLTCLWWGHRGARGSVLSSLEPREGHAHLFVVCFADLACFMSQRLRSI